MSFKNHHLVLFEKKIQLIIMKLITTLYYLYIKYIDILPKVFVPPFNKSLCYNNNNNQLDTTKSLFGLPSPSPHRPHTYPAYFGSSDNSADC